MDSNNVLEKWEELKTLLNMIEVDITKNARGVSAAGVRARKGLRDLRTRASELVKLTVVLDKEKKSTKKSSE